MPEVNNNIPGNISGVKEIQVKKFLVFALIVITTAVYFKSLDNQLTNFDDSLYITNNEDIRTLHGDSVSYTVIKAFSSFENGNYHPLTMLSYSIDYSLDELNPRVYHITNLLLHLANSILVFCFVWLLTKQQWVAFITALLFAIHPMHVESVAWVSARKDVLFSFFYISALCTYLIYLKKEKWKWHFYAITIILFVLSLLSKAMAVSLPVVLFAIDYFIARKITAKVVWEKVPLLVLSLIFGLIAMEAQDSANAIGDVTVYDFVGRILCASYALMMYLWKLLAPINLSCFYEYPIIENGYPLSFYIAPVIILALATLVYKSRYLGRDVIFGSAFFLITIAIVLQVLPVGNALLADRYTYLPYIGIFFIPARWINNIFQEKSENFQVVKRLLVAALSLILLGYFYLTYERSMVWYDSITLWGDAIEKSDRAPISFLGRGTAYIGNKQYDKALTDFNRAIQLKDDHAEAYYNRAMTHFYLEKYEKAIIDFSSAIEYGKNLDKKYFNRGLANLYLKRHSEAIVDFTFTITDDPNHAKAYYARSQAYAAIQNLQLAYEDALKAQQLGLNVDSNLIRNLQQAAMKQEITFDN